MTDKQAFIRICEHMGLERFPAETHDDGRLSVDFEGRDDAGNYIADKRYCYTDRELAVSCGEGYFGFYATFTFDENGRAVKHEVAE